MPWSGNTHAQPAMRNLFLDEGCPLLVVLRIGNRYREPCQTLGVSPGSIAVDLFFFCSGLLVTSSWWHAGSLWRFVLARAARILPGMWAMVAVTVLVLSAFSALPAAAYFSADTTWTYVLKNCTVLFGTTGSLPGVFRDTPYPHAVNGSLWTLPHELHCYGLLALVGVATAVLGRWHPAHAARLMTLAFAGAATGSAAMMLRAALQGAHDPRGRLLLMFSLGVLAYQLRHHIRLRWRWAALAAAVLAAGTLLQSRAFTAVYPLPLAYLALAAAYLPGGWLRRFNALGDYSFGVYIYAFPVQQVISVLQPQVGLAAHMLQSALVTLLLAAASWHLVERPALAAARRGSAHRPVALAARG